MRDPDPPLPVSSSILDHFEVCPTQWFLAREAGGVARQHQSANVGEMVHALAQRVAAGELQPGPDGVDELMGHVEQVWDRLEFRTPWARARELERIRSALSRFLAWHHASSRTLVGIEQPFRAVLELPNGEQVALAASPTASSSTPTAASWSWTSRPGATSRPPSRCSPTSSSGSTSSRSTTAPPTTSSTGGPAPEAPSSSSSGSPATMSTPLSSTQPDQADDGPERTALRDRLARTAALLRSENFPAIAGQHCSDCDFVPICPIKSAGQ